MNCLSAKRPVFGVSIILCFLMQVAITCQAAGTNDFTLEQREALLAINYYRTMAGLQKAELNADLCTSAQNHANYRITNSDALESAHSESPALHGFTGKSPYDRMTAAGFRGNSFAECISSGLQSGKDLVNALIRVPYHRLLFLQGATQEIGIGVGRASGRPTTWVFDMSSSRESITVWPPDNSKGVPLNGDVNESPNPMAVHTVRTKDIGYIVTAGFDSADYRLIETRLETPDRKAVELYVNHPGNDPNSRRSLLLIPQHPLLSNTTYHVSFKVRSPNGEMI